MSEDESHSLSQSGSNEASSGKDSAPSGESDAKTISSLKKRRAQLRGKITRSLNRVRKFIDQGADMRKRIEKELLQIQKDFELARECHAEMYEYADEGQTSTIDDWEDILTNDFYDIEKSVETFLQSLSVHEHANPMPQNNEQTVDQPADGNTSSLEPVGGTAGPNYEMPEEPLPQEATVGENDLTITPVGVSGTNISNGDFARDIACNSAPEEPKAHATKNSVSSPKSDLSSPESFDSWIDNLVEFEETVLSNRASEMSIAEALYKLEACKDIPSIKLIKYDGNPLTYVEFMERFKLHIHDKPHLSDDVRIVQLKMHLVSNAERAVSGLGSQGKMYATALKTLKEQFGQPSVIARPYINKLVDASKIQNNNREALQQLSFDVANSAATLKQINHLADVSATGNLRSIVKRLPDHMIDKWKATASDLREKGQTPSLEAISKFLRKRVKAKFDPDFGDIPKSGSQRPARKGIHSNQREKKLLQCYVCSENHRCRRLSNLRKLFQRRKNPVRQRPTTLLLMFKSRSCNERL
ncbi:uncharacterized protein LOC114526747 [Dendronephthya gigantea]|uniref:uncharacterized protein LOC114526747 n=1 Tax=Dendronephthya gigantea TaxID=151771 RepID=UPI00106C3277|nr:uncharacterized protein LOC114526747 [Dendronephthya gigantea]